MINVTEAVHAELRKMGEQRMEVFAEIEKAGQTGDWLAVNRLSNLLSTADARIEGFIAALEFFKAPQGATTQDASESSTSDIAVNQ